MTRLKSLSHFEGAEDHHFGAEGAGNIENIVGIANVHRLAPHVGDGDPETISIMSVAPHMGSAVGAQSVSNISNINVALPSNGGHYQRYHSPVSAASNFSRQSSVQTVVSAQSGLSGTLIALTTFHTAF